MLESENKKHSNDLHVYQSNRLGLAGWTDWPAPSYGYYSHEPANSTSLSHKRTSNDTNQPTEQADNGKRVESVASSV